jgi:outer membrane lipoprotein
MDSTKARHAVGTVFLFAVFVLAASCAPVFRKDFMATGIRDFSFRDILTNPHLYENRLFILGGIVANTTLTDQGSLIESLYVPVDSLGYPKPFHGPAQRFLALFPRELGILDPMIYRKDRQITLACTFVGIREGKIDTMGYTYPEFRVEQVYLWEEQPRVYYAPYRWDPYWDYWGRPGPYRWYPHR